jgi:hypothetical protein
LVVEHIADNNDVVENEEQLVQKEATENEK